MTTYELSQKERDKLDARTIEAFRKINQSFQMAVFTLRCPPPAGETAEEARDLETRHLNHFTQDVMWPRNVLCRDILVAQDAFAALCKKQKNEQSERSPSQQFALINRALAHESVEPYEICPGYKGTKEDMRKQAGRHVLIQRERVAFAARQKRTGSPYPCNT